MVKPAPRSSAVVSKKNTQSSRRKYLSIAYIFLFIAITAAYYLLTLLKKPDQKILHEYNISDSTYHWLIASVIVILTITWAASLFGSLVFKLYADKIKDSKDGRALNIISNGLIVLSLTQPIVTVLGALNAQFGSHHPNLIPKLTITTNYINLILTGAAMILIALGAEKLFQLVRGKLPSASQRWWVFLFIIGSSLYGYFIVIQPIHTPLARRVYYLPDWLLVVTIAIPYLCIWYLGLYAASQINTYRSNIRGLLYKSAIKYLAGGIALVIVSSVFTRVIITISMKLSQLSLTPLLLLIYALLLADAAGFILIAIGARRLRQIEEV